MAPVAPWISTPFRSQTVLSVGAGVPEKLPAAQVSTAPSLALPTRAVGVTPSGAVACGASPRLPLGAGRAPITIQARVAGVGSTFPEPSRARTAKACEPTASDVKVTGDVHAAKGRPSSEHSNPAVSVLDEEKAMVADVAVVEAGGPPVIAVPGGVVSPARGS